MLPHMVFVQSQYECITSNVIYKSIREYDSTLYVG